MSAHEPGKKFEDWTWEELQNYCAGEVLTQLIAGKLNYGIWITMNSTMNWLDAQEKKKIKN